MKLNISSWLIVCMTMLLGGGGVSAQVPDSERQDVEPQISVEEPGEAVVAPEVADGANTNWWLVSLSAAAVVGLVTVLGEGSEQDETDRSR